MTWPGGPYWGWPPQPRREGLTWTSNRTTGAPIFPGVHVCDTWREAIVAASSLKHARGKISIRRDRHGKWVVRWQQHAYLINGQAS